jgi:hypothetical protein
MCFIIDFQWEIIYYNHMVEWGIWVIDTASRNYLFIDIFALFGSFLEI